MLTVGNHGCFKLTRRNLLEEVSPFDLPEAGCFEVFIPVEASSQALLWVSIQHGFNNRSSVLICVLTREGERCSQHCLENPFGGVGVLAKRQETTNKFEEEHAQGPEVHLGGIPDTLHHLRSHVMWCPCYREGLRLSLFQFLSNAKVHQLHIAVRVKHDVLRFQVSVNDVPVVKRLQHQHQRPSVKLGMLARKLRHSAERSVQLPSSDQLRQHVHVMSGFELLHQVQHEGVVVGGQQSAFRNEVCGLLAFDLLDSFEGVSHASVSVHHTSHNSHPANSDETHSVEVVQGDARTLKAYQMHEVFPHLTFYYLRKVCPLHGPEFSRCTDNHHRCRARLVKQQSALAEVTILPNAAHEGACDVHIYLSFRDHEEGLPDLTFSDDAGAFLVPLHHEGVSKSIDLFLRKVVEGCDLLDDDHLPRVVECIVHGTHGRHAQLLQRLQQTRAGEHSKFGSIVTGMIGRVCRK
mmetsp:Transcript_14328/g.39024  ORF Transcript_14328/g.39024 Transcript_14328/m.39024 type:complete len:464 (+) Transcript_14328:318-1709(+)